MAKPGAKVLPVLDDRQYAFDPAGSLIIRSNGQVIFGKDTGLNHSETKDGGRSIEELGAEKQAILQNIARAHIQKQQLEKQIELATVKVSLSMFTV